MEGGHLPWKLQTVKDKPIDMNELLKPLPPPPNGYFWEKNEDGSWILCKYKNDGPIFDESFIKFEKPSVIEHVVMEDDTFPGLCLRYHVTAIQLRRANSFSGNNIKGFKTLRIPISSDQPIQVQVDKVEVILQKFRNISHEDKKEAHFYLEECNWDLDSAIAMWRGDESWNKTNTERPPDFSGMDESTYDAWVVRAEATIVRPAAVKISNHTTIPSSAYSLNPPLTAVVSPRKVSLGSLFPWGRRSNANRNLPIATSRDLGLVPPIVYGDPAALSLI